MAEINPFGDSEMLFIRLLLNIALKNPVSKNSGKKKMRSAWRFLEEPKQHQPRQDNLQQFIPARGNKKLSEEETANKAEVVIEPDGDGYRVLHLGKEGHYKKLKGFDYLYTLIQNPGKRIPMTELIGAGSDDRVTADQSSFQPIYDIEALKSFSLEIKRLEEEEERFKKDQRFSEADHCREQIESIRREKKKSTGLSGHSRNLDPSRGKMRGSIHGALNTAYETLRNGTPPMNELAVFLKQHVHSEGGCFIFDPDRNLGQS
jgi:hypothetical protein